MTTALQVRGVSKSYGGATIVDDVDLDAADGCITIIVGPNGAGKTTLFNCLSGVDPPDRGAVVHRGGDVTRWSPDALSRHGIARTFQRSSVFPTMTVAENLLVAAENRRRGGLLRGLSGMIDRQERDSDRVVASVLDELGLTLLASRHAGGLPSGTLRLVELGRALCTRPDTVLLDEPASGLDDNETDEFHAVLRRLRERNLAVLMVEHDLQLVHEAADVVYVMASGRVVASGTPADVFARTDVREMFGQRS